MGARRARVPGVRVGREREATVKMEALEAARLAAPVEIHDAPTAPIPLHQLEDALARSLGPRSRLARGSAGADVQVDPDLELELAAAGAIEAPMVRTFPARHPWLVTAAALAVAVLLLLALHGSAGP